ncbi:MAG: hypothetical protein LUQ21_02655, partial [Methanothrix sp.]|nr:hypothetical protein [Methanothrix sp.]
MLLLGLILLSAPASSHVPLMAGDNDNISRAMHISDADKSWAVYGLLPEQAAHYYSLDRKEGERIYLSLFRTADPAENGYRPALLLIGPGLKEDIKPDHLPPLPPGAWQLKLLRADEKTATATYEPFGPSSFIELAEINITAPEAGRYYAAVYESASASIGSNSSHVSWGKGHYGLAVGYKEEFSFTDRFLTPLRLISVYLWEGQNLGMILIPYQLAGIIALLFFWRGSRRTSFCLAGLLAGFLFLATSASVFNQMVFSLTRAPLGPEVYITLAIGVFHALLGVASIRLARGEAG